MREAYDSHATGAHSVLEVQAHVAGVHRADEISRGQQRTLHDLVGALRCGGWDHSCPVLFAALAHPDI